jgi:hypothetical protein
MKPEMIAFLKDLADVLKKHKGGLSYTNNDDGIHVMINDDWSKASRVCIGWPANGNVSDIEDILGNLPEFEKAQEPETLFLSKHPWLIDYFLLKDADQKIIGKCGTAEGAEKWCKENNYICKRVD